MTEAHAAVGMDRLPWLDDEPSPSRSERKPSPAPRSRPARTTREHGARELAGWAVAAVMLVAGGSYWLGTRSAPETYQRPGSATPGATVQLPEARDTTPSVEIPPTPEVKPAPAPEVAIARPRIDKPAQRRSVSARRKLSPMTLEKPELEKTVATQEGKPAAARAVPPAPAVKPLASRSELKLWPSRVTQGAYGRVVRIGAFGSRQQAKLGWRKMQRAYPAVGRLPAVVVTTRNSRGRLFYRFQIGTTSQAHSEVLCQRMQKIRFSCAVIGLPWMPQGVER